MDSAALGTTAVIAAVMVPIVSLIKTDKMTSKQRYALGLAASFVAALIGGVVDGHVKDVKGAVAYLGTAVAVAQTVYGLFFKDSGLDQKLTEMGN
jgi:hypothetical protein